MEGKYSNFKVEKPETVLVKWLRLALPVIQTLIMDPSGDEMRRAFHVHVVISQNKFTVTWENIRQVPVEGHSTEYLISTLQISQGPEKQGKTEKFTDLEMSKEAWRLNALWYMYFNQSWVEKNDIKIKTDKIQ